jgi:hypothetical protein
VLVYVVLDVIVSIVLAVTPTVMPEYATLMRVVTAELRKTTRLTAVPSETVVDVAAVAVAKRVVLDQN